MENYIEIDNLRVAYGNKDILHQLNLRIDQGMYGLLGRNGAGKTTLMKTIAGLLPAKSGHVNLCGLKDKTGKRQVIGYLPQDFTFYDNMSIKESLDYLACLSGMSKADIQDRMFHVLRAVNLNHCSKKKVKTLSGGMKRRLGIAQAIFHNPRVLIVDEPTAGLDPEERIRLRHLLNDLAKDRVVLLSTHIAEDIEKTCDSLAVLHQGRFIYTGKVADLIDKTQGLTYKTTMTPEAFETFSKTHLVYNRQHRQGHIDVSFIHTGPPAPTFQSTPATIEAAYLNLIYDEGGVNR